MAVSEAPPDVPVAVGKRAQRLTMAFMMQAVAPIVGQFLQGIPDFFEQAWVQFGNKLEEAIAVR